VRPAGWEDSSRNFGSKEGGDSLLTGRTATGLRHLVIWHYLRVVMCRREGGLLAQEIIENSIGVDLKCVDWGRAAGSGYLVIWYYLSSNCSKGVACWLKR